MIADPHGSSFKALDGEVQMEVQMTSNKKIVMQACCLISLLLFRSSHLFFLGLPTLTFASLLRHHPDRSTLMPPACGARHDGVAIACQSYKFVFGIRVVAGQKTFFIAIRMPSSAALLLCLLTLVINMSVFAAPDFGSNCRNIDAMKSSFVNKSFETDKLAGIWYEQAYIDIAQVSIFVPTSFFCELFSNNTSGYQNALV